MSNIVKKWQNTSAIIDSNSTLKEVLEKQNIKGILKKDGYYIFNPKNIWIFEEEFIDVPNHTLQQIFDKLSYKNYDRIKYFDRDTEEFIVYTGGHSVESYSKIIRSNVIDGVSVDKLNISLELLSQSGYESKSERVQHLIDIYILIMLSNRTKRVQNELEFTFEGEQDSFSCKTEFGDKNFDRGLWELFHWIVNSQEYSEAYKVKLQIVRVLINKRKHLKDLTSLKDQSESIFNRIVSGKTDKYFEFQNNLKEDFIKISRGIKEYNSGLNTKLFGWLTAFSLIIFDFIKESDGKNLFRRVIFSTSEKIKLLLLLLFGALVIIMIMYNLDIKTIKKQYQSLKEFYVSQMFVSKDEFDKFIEEPKYCNWYNFLLVCLLFVLLLRFLIA
ncbi:hypothetical protein [Streptococcus acidominimus]|uniref:Uncharacterized protein n=1 Tax=Streptococcus acidominimus TaxID=1326 RepID=A0A1Q8ECM6_STRAI|nr:hypothetical protein [Streptococcus acidominimus]MBF0848400.1 hypothetical protein [Streptococcus danieliae]MBF0818245.1 hypothetical protein [Streptococcus acidominimus]MBF0838562.1 hypothetical protein [Streptococcus acidominimus]OLF49542.1 hypothetical protein BU200_06815 [Streptococcus acidominimus]TFU31544.1 hypothetical protein E4U01_02080 [Streptococcus acidominimus]